MIEIAGNNNQGINIFPPYDSLCHDNIDDENSQVTQVGGDITINIPEPWKCHDKKKVGNPLGIRSELEEPKELGPQEGEVHEYSFDMNIPEGFPVDSQRLMFAQFKQQFPEKVSLRKQGYDETKISFSPSPVLAFRIQKGHFMATIDHDNKLIESGKKRPGRRVLYDQDVSDGNIAGKYTFKMRVKFSRNEREGFVQLEIGKNGKQLTNTEYRGKTAYDADSGFPGEGKFYFKFGPYGNHEKIDGSPVDQPMSLAYGNIQHRKIQESGTVAFGVKEQVGILVP